MTRIQKILAVSAAATAALSVSSAAWAVIPAPTQTNSQTYIQDLANFQQSQVICDFNGPNCVAGYTISFNGLGTGLYTGNVLNQVAAPPGDPTQYVGVLGPQGTASLVSTAGAFGLFSFYMGSPDFYNSITFYSGNTPVQTFTGGQYVGATTNGDQQVGRRIFFDLTGNNITRVDFGSTQNAFEFDRVGIGPGVPEPATWAMMILGMGMVGLGLRMRRRQASALA